MESQLYLTDGRLRLNLFRNTLIHPDKSSGRIIEHYL
jgi:hypothetical protein